MATSNSKGKLRRNEVRRQRDQRIKPSQVWLQRVGLSRVAIGLGFVAVGIAIVLYGANPFPYYEDQEVRGSHVLLATGRGADVARAMALPVFGGMLIEPFTTFIVPTLYCAYIEFKMRAGLQDDYWVDAHDTETGRSDTVENVAA